MTLLRRPVEPLPPPVVDKTDPYQVRALAVGLHPGLSRALLVRLTKTDFKNARHAIRTALAKTPDDKVFGPVADTSRAQGFDDGLDRLRLQILRPSVGIETRQVDARPTGDQRESSLVEAVTAIVLELRLRRCVGFPHDGAQ